MKTYSLPGWSVRIAVPALLLLSSIACKEQPAKFNFPERGFLSTEPATDWEHALVSGNGKFGALVFGQPLDEKIILNHARLYLPLHEPLPPVNTAAHLNEIRKMISDGQYQSAADFVVALSEKENYGPKRWTDPFIPAFDIKIRMSSDGEVKNYYRAVDFSTGVASVNWCDKRDSFQRKLFVSRPDDAVVLSIAGHKKGSVSCTLRLAQEPAQGSGYWDPVKKFKEGIKEFKTYAEPGWLSYRSSFTRRWKGSLQGYEGVSRIIVKGGSSVVAGDSVIITGANEVMLITRIELLKDYDNSQIEVVKKALSEINPEFTALVERHSKIHGEIFNRSRLDLGGGSDPNLTSEELISKSHMGTLNPALLEKQYDAARYNILSSSGEMFPNLQGIWGGTYGPEWSGDFTLNGNVQSAIAADLSTNMAECLEPFFRWHEDHMDEFRLNAKNFYGCRGILVPSRASSHGLNNHFDATWPMTFWTAGAGWNAQFFYDYYLYTGDKEFLSKRALPFMRETALFYEDFMIPGPDGKLIFNPSYSPENNPGNSKSQACINSAMDIGVARELLKNCIAASEILNVGAEDIVRWKSMLNKMTPYLIDNNGELKEWATPLLDNNDLHRHCSHLFAIYNGLPEEIANDEKLKNAFDIALEKRLDLRRRGFKGETFKDFIAGDMAFGIVFQGLAAASLHKEIDCAEILDWLSNGYWFNNFVTTHNIRQIFNTDLSGGFPAIVAKMLVDSKPGWICLLPAWAENLPSGKIEGLALRGQIILKELSWKGKNISALFNSAVNQKVQLEACREIQSMTGDGNCKITKENNQYCLSLPANQTIAVKIVLK